jgi:hypothetical protein
VKGSAPQLNNEEELSSMRRSIRILKVLVGLCAASLVLVAVLLWKGSNDVRAHSITLLDSAGRAVAVLENAENGPALTLWEPGGVVVLGDLKGDTGLGVVSANHEHIMHLLLGPDGFPALSLSSPGAGLGVAIAGRRPAIIFKTDDKMRLTITDDTLRMFDDAGASVNLLSAMKDAAEAKP